MFVQKFLRFREKTEPKPKFDLTKMNKSNNKQKRNHKKLINEYGLQKTLRTKSRENC